jgi:hypothetical protein
MGINSAATRPATAAHPARIYAPFKPAQNNIDRQYSGHR